VAYAPYKKAYNERKPNLYETGLLPLIILFFNKISKPTPSQMNQSIPNQAKEFDRLMVIDDDNKKTMKKAFIIQVAKECLVRCILDVC
jgi:hypothetical protein